MMQMSLFIRDSLVFEARRRRLEELLRSESGLPEQIFRKDFVWFAFEEFDWAMSADFWPEAQRLARGSNDSSVLMAVLDPSPSDYYKKEFGVYNWAELSIGLSSDDYWSLLNHHPKSSPADSVIANSEKIVWFPESGKWAVWGERSYGVCVLGARAKLSLDSWHDVEWALQNYLPNCFREQVVPSDFARTLRLNYGA